MPRIWFEQNQTTFARARGSSMNEITRSFAACSSTRSSPRTDQEPVLLLPQQMSAPAEGAERARLRRLVTRRRGFGEGAPTRLLVPHHLGLCARAESKGIGPPTCPGSPTRAIDPAKPRPPVRRQRVRMRARRGLQSPPGPLSRHVEARALGPHEGRRDQAGRVRTLPDPGGACEFYLEYDPGHRGVRRALPEARGLSPARGGVDGGAGPSRVPESPHHRSGGVREGEVGSALRHAIGRLHVRGSLATSFPLYVAGEDQLCGLGGARAGVEAPDYGRRASPVRRPAFQAGPNDRVDHTSLSVFPPPGARQVFRPTAGGPDKIFGRRPLEGEVGAAWSAPLDDR